jgi:hypothetical protein
MSGFGESAGVARVLADSFRRAALTADAHGLTCNVEHFTVRVN